MFEATDPLIESTMKAVENRLWCKTKIEGMARYENDRHLQISQDIASVPGNPWDICTLWIAQYHIARAQTIEELRLALPIFEWAYTRALPSGIMAEPRLMKVIIGY